MNLENLVSTLVLAGTLLALALTGCSDPASASAPPEQVVEEFYHWHLGYPGNSLVDRAYRDNEFLAPSLIRHVDELLDDFDKGGFDPFLLAQDLPEEITVEDATIEAKVATVVTHQRFGGNPDVRHVSVELALFGDEWKITGIVAPSAPVSQPVLGPVETVESFYGWYLGYIGDPATDTFRNPMVDRAYRGHELLTGRLVRQVDELLNSFEGAGYDPFMCAQDIPQTMTAEEITLNNGSAEVEVETSFAGHHFRVDLLRQDGAWKIDEIRCAASGAH